MPEPIDVEARSLNFEFNIECYDEGLAQTINRELILTVQSAHGRKLPRW
jgi:hypothetical protein